MDTRDNNLNNSPNSSKPTNNNLATPTSEPLRHETSGRSIPHGEYHEMDPRFEADRETARRDERIPSDRIGAEGASTLTQIEGKIERIYNQVESTLTSQLKLAKTEINEKIEQVESGAMSLTAGGVVTFFGAQVLVFAAVVLLDFILPLWGSALIVSGILLAIGMALLAKGKKDLEPSSLKPNRTINQARETANTVRREL